MSKDIKTWADRFTESNDLRSVQSHMMDEIAELRAALATPPVASGALPELPEPALEMTDLYHAGQMRAYGQACAAAAAPNAALVAALEDAASALEGVEADRFNVDMDAVSMAASSARAALAQAGAA